MTPQGISGAVFNMFTHGLISPMLFLIAGVIYDRAHHREIDGFGGLAQALPEYTGDRRASPSSPRSACPAWPASSPSSWSSPGAFPRLHAPSPSSRPPRVIITAAYYLWAIQRMFLGKLNPMYAGLPGPELARAAHALPAGRVVIVLGFYPQADPRRHQHRRSHSSSRAVRADVAQARGRAMEPASTSLRVNLASAGLVPARAGPHRGRRCCCFLLGPGLAKSEPRAACPSLTVGGAGRASAWRRRCLGRAAARAAGPLQRHDRQRRASPPSSSGCSSPPAR